MKKLIVLIFAPIFLSSCVSTKEHKKEDKDDSIVTAESLDTNDMLKYSQDTKVMVRDGKYETALKRFVWFHENSLKYDPEIRGVRLSYALSDWKDLGDIYPPAIAALVEIRDRDTKKVLENGEISLFKDVSSINRVLGEEKSSFSLFETLAKKYPSMQSKYWTWVDNALLEAKRYDIIKVYIGSPLNQYQIFKKDLDFAMDSSKENKYLKNNFAKSCTQLIQYCLAMDDMTSAKEIQKMALTVVDNIDLANAIPN